MVTLVPRIWLIKVDLPTLGRPTMVTKPDRRVSALAACSLTTGWSLTTRWAVVVGGRARPGLHQGTMRILPTRLPSTRSATRVRPSTSTDSPSTGTRPSTLKSKPADGVPFAGGQMGVDEFAQLVDGQTGGDGEIAVVERLDRRFLHVVLVDDLPTSSSIRSSRVTTPAVPPYSSTTTAR